MKQRILSGWNIIRILWLMTGIGITIQAIIEKKFLMLIPGLYLVFGSLANIGCFSGSCAAGYTGNTKPKKEASANNV